MNLLPPVFFAVIAAAMYWTLGHYSSTSGPYVLLFYATIAAMVCRNRVPASREKVWNTLLALTAVGSILAILHFPEMIYANPRSDWRSLFDILMGGALICSVLVLMGVLRPNGRPGRALRWAGPAAITLLLLAQCLVPLISPRPFIDVFVNNTRATDHFLHGANPYTQIYPDIYRGYYDYKPGFLYFPGLLYWLAPFRAIFGDIRYGYVFANLLIALGLGGIARRLRAPENGNAPMRLLAPLLWLSFPVTFFVLEQSWIDTVLIALTVLTFWALEEDKWIVAGALMGAAFSVKQYGFLVGLVACIQIWRRAGLGTAMKAAVAAAITAGAVILPFAIADWRHFYASTITSQASSAVRLDAYNATSFIALNFHWVLPGFVQAALSALGIGAGVLFVARLRHPRLADSATALLLGYGTAFLFGKFAFCNYHYLLAGILLLYLVGASSESWSPTARGSRERTSEICKAPSAPAGT